MSRGQKERRRSNRELNKRRAAYYNEASSRAFSIGSFEEKLVGRRKKSRRVTVSAVCVVACRSVESKERRGGSRSRGNSNNSRDSEVAMVSVSWTGKKKARWMR